MQCTVYISNTPVTLKQSQGHQTYTDNVGPKEGYNHARFERSGLNGIWETPTKEIIVSYLCPNVQVLSNEKTCQLSLLNIREKEKKVVYSWSPWRNQVSYKASIYSDKKIFFFQLKLFDTAVTLKCNQDHRKWYEWVKLNENYYHAQFDIYHGYSVREKFISSFVSLTHRLCFHHLSVLTQLAAE